MAEDLKHLLIETNPEFRELASKHHSLDSRLHELESKPYPTDAEQFELMHLATELNELGVARTHPNPYFELFANAMARRSRHEAHSFSKEEIDAQARLADEVLAELLHDESRERESDA